jgi:hypothetical protein
MLDCDGANVPVTIQIHDRVFIEILRLQNLCPAKLNVQGVGVFKISDFHGRNDRSKMRYALFRDLAARSREGTCCQLPGSWPNIGCAHPFGKFPFQDFFTAHSIHSSLMNERSGRCRMVSKYRVNFREEIIPKNTANA